MTYDPPDLPRGPDGVAARTGAAALRVSRISKVFGATAALRGVNLEIRGGEVHALVGGNGSGKSTLMKVLAGVHQAEPGGSITVHGDEFPADRFTPPDAKRAGFRFVHQALGLFPDLTVAENLVIGRGYELANGGRIRWHALRARAAHLLERFDVHAAPDTLVADLSPADQSLVAIVRALQDQDGSTPGLLVLDEPTASLPAKEVDALLAALRRYANAGQTILFVSHRLDEVLRLADRVSVLRDGRRVATVAAADVRERDLARMMFARDIERKRRGRRVDDGRVALEIRELAVGPVRDVSLRVQVGEVVGLAGLRGSGRSELLKVLFGARQPERGDVLLHGTVARFRAPREAIAAGLALVPEDRAGEGVLPTLSVSENLSAACVREYWRGWRLRHRLERAEAAALVSRYGIRPPRCEVPLWVLSGGNQQKVLLARWLRGFPQVLLLDEPTQGVDIGARTEIHELVRRVADEGSAVLVASSDFEELVELTDRTLVVGGGCVIAEAAGPELNAHRLAELSHVAS